MARPKGQRKEARISVSFDSGDYVRLRGLAAHSDVSVAWLIRRAVHELLRREQDNADNPELPWIGRADTREGER
jgi:hypothetical protein